MQFTRLNLNEKPDRHRKKSWSIGNWLVVCPLRTNRLTPPRDQIGWSGHRRDTVAIERNVTNKQDMEFWQTLPATKVGSPVAVGKLRRLSGRTIATDCLNEKIHARQRGSRIRLGSKKESSDLKEVKNRSDTQRDRTPTKPFGGWSWKRDGTELATGMLIRLRMTWPVLDLQ